MTLKFDGWPRKTIGHLFYLFYTMLSFVLHFKTTGELKLELQSRKAQFGSKSTICPLWPWNLMDDLEKQYGTSSMSLQALCIISLPYVNSNWSYDLETAKWVHDLCDLDLWPLTLTICIYITFVNGNMNSWKFQDDRMTGTLSKRCDRWTDWQTDGRTERSVL